MNTYQINKNETTETTTIIFDKHYFLTNCLNATIDFDDIDNGSDTVTFDIVFIDGKPHFGFGPIFDESEISQFFNDDICKSLIAIQPLLNNNENPY